MPRIRSGWTCERIAAALNYVSATSASKGLNPALEKIALLKLLDPISTDADLVDFMEHTPKLVLDAARRRLAVFDEREIEQEVERLELRREPQSIKPSGGRRPELGICKTTLPKD